MTKEQMELNSEVLEEIVEQIVEAGLARRHRHRTLDHLRNIYGITPRNAEDRVEDIFKITIQARSQPLNEKEYDKLLDKFDQEKFLSFDSQEDAFTWLVGSSEEDGFDNIGQKVANEFLRKTVDVYQLHDWADELHVPLDTHIKKSLVELGAVDLGHKEEEELDWDSNDPVINMKPTRDVNPDFKIKYYDLQDALRDAAEEYGHRRIVFDELWIEHKYFLTDPLLRKQSCLADLFN